MKKTLIALALFALALPAASLATGPPSQVAIDQLSQAGTGSAQVNAPSSWTIKGGIDGQPISGYYLGRITTDLGATAVTSDRGTCTPAGGTVDLQRTGDNDRLTLDVTGAMCQLVANGPYMFTGTYSIDSGDGMWSDSGVGTGSVSLNLGANGTSALTFSGAFDPNATRQPI